MCFFNFSPMELFAFSWCLLVFSFENVTLINQVPYKHFDCWGALLPEASAAGILGGSNSKRAKRPKGKAKSKAAAKK